MGIGVSHYDDDDPELARWRAQTAAGERLYAAMKQRWVDLLGPGREDECERAMLSAARAFLLGTLSRRPAKP